MIKKLRRRFILISMATVIVVLSVIIALMNVLNYLNVNTDADRILNVLAENEGQFPRNVEDRGLPADTPYNTRYFYVVIDTVDGEPIITNTENIETVDGETAEEYALEVFRSGKKSGYRKDFRFMASEWPQNQPADTESRDFMYIFLDRSVELTQFRNYLFISIVIGILGLLLIFAIVYAVSWRIMRPAIESNKRQKQFITDAGHEIKTPLAIIEANTDVIEMTGGENEWTESIKNQVRRLTSLTENLIYLSKADELEKQIKFVKFSLSDAVTETLQTFRPVVETRNRTLETDIEDGVTLKGDEQSIREALNLLLDNAVKYSDEGGTIAVTLKSSGRGAVLTVYNTVESIEEGKHDEFFARFYRPDKSRSAQTGGHGIGMSLVKAIADMHGGKVSARSDDTKSLTVTVTL